MHTNRLLCKSPRFHNKEHNGSNVYVEEVSKGPRALRIYFEMALILRKITCAATIHCYVSISQRYSALMGANVQMRLAEQKKKSLNNIFTS